MFQYKFFSYDFFIDGFFGMAVFVIVTAVFLTLASYILYGFLITAKLGIIEQKRKNKNIAYRAMTYIGIVVSIIIHFCFLEQFYIQEKIELFYAIIIISLLICSLSLSFAGHGLKHNIQNWITPLLFIFFTALLPFMYQEETTTIVSLGLKGFNIGGEKDVTIKELGKDKSLNGKLLLLSPNNVYLKNTDKSLLIVPISERTNIEIW
jgi:hypothetical protein